MPWLETAVGWGWDCELQPAMTIAAAAIKSSLFIVLASVNWNNI
jgi:hypothetical protein